MSANVASSATAEIKPLPLDHPFMQLFAEFDSALKEASPELEQYLDKLRRDIQDTPELVWTLTDEQLGRIISGAAVVSRIEIASTTGAKKKKADIGAIEDALDSVVSGVKKPVAKKDKALANEMDDIFAKMDSATPANKSQQSVAKATISSGNASVGEGKKAENQMGGAQVTKVDPLAALKDNPATAGLSMKERMALKKAQGGG